MKPAPFEYCAPTSLSEAIELLHQHGDDAKILAGGQSLMPLLNFRLTKPGVLIDINRVNELAYVREVDNTIAVGAATRQREVLDSESVRRTCPILGEAVSYIGHPAIRNRGTVGGSIVHADPAAELTVLSRVLDVELVVRSQRRERVVKADEFFVSYFSTSLEADELLTEVRFPTLGARTGWSFLEVSRRHGDFAVVAVATVVRLDARGHCESAGVALGGVAETPVRAHSVSQALAGTDPTRVALAKAAELVKGEIQPQADIHASAEYRRHVAGVLVRRTLESAVEMARASS